MWGSDVWLRRTETEAAEDRAARREVVVMVVAAKCMVVVVVVVVIVFVYVSKYLDRDESRSGWRTVCQRRDDIRLEFSAVAAAAAPTNIFGNDDACPRECSLVFAHRPQRWVGFGQLGRENTKTRSARYLSGKPRSCYHLLILTAYKC